MQKKSFKHCCSLFDYNKHKNKNKAVSRRSDPEH
jgi:hypothetical protein